MVYDIFLSYSRSDMIVADRICKNFQRAGLKCFVDRTCIPPGVDYETYLRHAIRKSKVFVFISSVHSWKSSWALEEILEFLNDCDVERLFIIKIDDYPIPFSEHDFDQIDGKAYIADISGKDVSVTYEFASDIKSMCEHISIDDNNDVLPDVPFRTFISHSHADNGIADQLYSYLRGNGIDCWMDLYDIPPGVPYAKAIAEGICQSQCLIVLFSKNVQSSEDILNEIDIAHRKGLRIIPFLLDNSKMPEEFMYYLSRKQWIEGFPVAEEKFELLLTVLK